MDILVLIGQRKQSYAGQYAPEALEVIDAIGDDENPDFMIDKKAEYERGGQFDALSVIRVQVDNPFPKSLAPEPTRPYPTKPECSEPEPDTDTRGDGTFTLSFSVSTSLGVAALVCLYGLAFVWFGYQLWALTR